jgi:protein-L-isoaspartate(D-aspartate) O-methyltransferase
MGIVADSAKGSEAAWIVRMTDFAAAREAMVDTQVRTADVTRYSIIDAMLRVPRELFVPKARRDVAYAEAEIPLAAGRAMPTPRTLSKMLDAAAITRSDLVLEIAPGTGYSTAVIARMAAAVVAVELDAGLCAQATEALQKLEVINAVVSEGDPAAGDPEHGPYDVIFVNGAVEQVPEALTNQLKDGGRLVTIFNEHGVGQCRIVLRVGDTISMRYAFDAPAPLIPGFETKRAFAF